MKETLFLGCIIGGGCVRPDREKLEEAVLKLPVPTTMRAIRFFWGLCDYYRRFIPNFGTLATPLTNATAKTAPNQVEWSENCEEAFCVLKQVLTSPSLVFSPDFTRRFVAHTDALDVRIGAVLAQTVDDHEYPAAYASGKLLPTPPWRRRASRPCILVLSLVTRCWLLTGEGAWCHEQLSFVTNYT